MAMGSHESTRAKSTTYLTPPEIIQALGSFDLDPCCPAKMPWATASRMIALPTDGLAATWFSTERVWCNPPYGREASDWLKKMAGHNFGTALIFARTETEAWQRYVWPFASGVLFLKGRLHFYLPNGARLAANSGAPSALVAYGQVDAVRLKNSRLPGAFVSNVRMQS